MKLTNLLLTCGNWDETSRLFIVYDECKAVTMTVEEAIRSSNDAEVYWFRDNVVILV